MATTESEDWATEEDGDVSTDDVLEQVVSSYPTLEGDGASVLGDEENELDRTAVTSHPDLALSQEDNTKTSALASEDSEFLQRTTEEEDAGYEAGEDEERDQEDLDLDEEEGKDGEEGEREGERVCLEEGELESQEGTASASEAESESDTETEPTAVVLEELEPAGELLHAGEEGEGEDEEVGVVTQRDEELENYQSTVQELSAALIERGEKLDEHVIRLSEVERQLAQAIVEKSELEEIAANYQESSQQLQEQLQDLLAEKQVIDEQREQLVSNLDTEKVARAAVDSDLAITKKQLHSTLEELKEAEELISELRQPPPDVPGADRQELLRLLDRRQHEISQLSEEWRHLASKLETTSAAKSEIQVRMEEQATQEASLKLREQLLSHEKELVRSQNEWLSRELQDKSEQLLRVKKEKAAVLSDLEGKLAARELDVSHMSRELEAVTTSKRELEGKAEAYLRKIRDSRAEQVAVEEQLRKELSSQSRLAELYQSASQEAQSKVDELLRGADSMQQILEDVSQEKEKFEMQLNEAICRHDAEVQELTSKVVTLETELSRANDLLAAAKGRSLPLSDADILSLSPSVSRASAMLKSGMTLTQIYSQYVEVSESYEKEKQERQQVSNYLQQVLEELDEKTPALQQLRRNYDTAVQNCDQLTTQLSTTVEECQTLRMESEEAIKQSRIIERENKRLKMLTGDLGRQVQILLKECEEARGGVVSSSHDQSHDISSDDISSSSQVISTHLVTFKSIEDLQKQNEKLLAVVRELSEEQEMKERETVDVHTKELQLQLQTALQEVEDLREGRERQKEMVSAVVKQRDMYRTLLAQSTPLPVETGQTPGSKVTPTKGAEAVAVVTIPTTQIDQETTQALKELKEQFTAYRREKGENEAIVAQQMDTLRQEASGLRMDNVKITAKLEHAHERYKLVETHSSGHKRELESLREKNRQLSDSLSRHQGNLSATTQELLSARERLAKAEISLHSLRAEHTSLQQREKQARAMYEDALRERKNQNLLLVNLQTIQNNLERSEFETKNRLGGKIEVLEREIAMYKQRLTSEEERRGRMVDAYETQVKDLREKLDTSSESLRKTQEQLRESEERGREGREEGERVRKELEETTARAEELKDKVIRLEQDAGAEFRQRMSTLKRQLEDAKGQGESLETQLQLSRQHAEQYKEMSLANENALAELNKTSEEFRSQMEEKVAESSAREEELKSRLEQLESEKEDIETEYKSLSESTSEKISNLESNLSESVTRIEELLLELSSAQQEVGVAKEDARKFSEQAVSTQELYERELLQHGKSMESLHRVKEEVTNLQQLLTEATSESSLLHEKLTSSLSSLEEQTRTHGEEREHLLKRAEDLSQQNALLHEEAEKLSAKILTLQEQGREATPTLPVATVSTDTSADQLWEIIRFTRREKEIAETKRELAEFESLRNGQKVEHLERSLCEVEQALRESEDAAKAQSETASQHAEILAKVDNLNLLTDSNRLLREERASLSRQVSELEGNTQQLSDDLQQLRENNRTLVGQKDALVAEKTALRNEVQRWNTRTNQLIEQYNKVDPEDYKKLLEERDTTTAKITSLETELASVNSNLATVRDEMQLLEREGERVRGEAEGLRREKEEEEGKVAELKKEVAAKADDVQAKTKMIAKLRELGRKYRTLSEDQKKTVEKLKLELEEAKKKAEEVPPPTEPAPMSTEAAEKTQQLEATVESQKASLQEKEEKYNKMVKTLKAARSRIDTLKTDKDQVSRELEESQNERQKLTTEVEDLQLRLDALTSKYSSDGKRQQQQIAKLQQQLRERPARRKAVAPSVQEGLSTLSPAQTAPTAAVKPTVTTTPTASIRPMAIQTTSAPTAHVTPTMVTQHMHAPSVSVASTNQIQPPVAAVFVRTTSPKVVAPIMSVVNTTTASSATIASTNMASITSTSSVPPLLTATTMAAAVPIVTATVMASTESATSMASSAPMIVPIASTTIMASGSTVASVGTAVSTTTRVSAIPIVSTTTAASVTSNTVSPTTTSNNIASATAMASVTISPPSTGTASGVVSSSATIARQLSEVERKRVREEEMSEPGSSLEPPSTKRQRQQVPESSGEEASSLSTTLPPSQSHQSHPSLRPATSEQEAAANSPAEVMEEEMQAMPSAVVSQAPNLVLEPDLVSQHGMETVQQQVADTEQDREMRDVVKEGEGEGEEVISVHVESSESLQPSTSHEVVKPVSIPVGPEVMEGRDTVQVVAADEQLVQPQVEQTLKPIEQVSLVAPIQLQPMQELVRPVSEEPVEEPESQMESGFKQTTLEQADTTQGEGVEPGVGMETGVAMETNVGATDAETEQGREEERGGEEEGDSGVQDAEEEGRSIGSVEREVMTVVRQIMEEEGESGESEEEEGEGEEVEESAEEEEEYEEEEDYEDEEEDSDTEEYEGETQYPHMPVSIAWSGGPVVVDAGTEATPIVIDSSSEEEGGGEVEEEGEEEQREGGFRMQLSETESEEGEVDQSHDVPVIPPSVLESENSMGLPDDEISISIAAPVSTTHTRPTTGIISGPLRSRYVPIPYQRSTSIPTPNFEMVAEDAGVVPHTPVLEGHQLSKVQTIPTPQEVRPVSVPHIPESSLTGSIHAPGLQLLGDTQVPLSSVATVPPTAESRDTSSATISLVEREGGDVPDDVIDSMVAAVASSGEEEGEGEGEEEGELIEEERGDIEEGELADDDEDTTATPSSLPHTSTSTSLPVPSTSSLVTTSASASRAKTNEAHKRVGQSHRTKRQPIVWDEPSSSGTAAASGTSRPQGRRHIKIQRGTGRRSLRFKGRGQPFRK